MIEESMPADSPPPTEPLPAGRLLAWREEVRRVLLDAGFDLVGFTTAEPLSDAVGRRWRRRLAEDRFGEMTWLARPHPRRTHPRDLLPEARSVIVVAASYRVAGDEDGRAPERDDPGGTPRGRIARYARGRDYHLSLRERLNEVGAGIARAAAARGWSVPVTWRAVADSAPLDERALAVRAGLGFVGKNTLLIHPRLGSWFVLGALLTSVPFPEDAGDLGEMEDEATGVDATREPGAPASCGSCRRCLDACPTDALVAPWDLDPRRCISYLTIESRTPIPEDLAARFGDRVFGCDACQEVCPFNATPPLARIPDFAPERGAGEFFGEAELAAVPSGKAFERRYRESPLARAGRRGMVRNLEAVARAATAGDLTRSEPRPPRRSPS